MASLPPEADVIIVGAGTAGCVLAARLSEDPDLRVLVVEAGRADRSPWIHIPVGFSRLLDDAGLNWCYETESQFGLAGRTIPWPRGKVVGGSSAINGMVWVRGAPRDYDRWAATVGDPVWSWTETEALFRRCEAAPSDADARLGRDGRMPLARPRHDHPLVRAFIEAGVNAGLAERRDLGISDHVGVGPYLTTIRRGLRVSAAGAYLKPALRRDNLELATASTVCGVTLASGHRAVGVRLTRLGTPVLVRARRGVVLAAGAVDTPKLLMLSGIGSGPDLAGLGIPVAVESPEVGGNLQDHFGVRVVAEVGRPITINDDFRRPWRLAGHALRYAVARTGPLAMGGAYAGAFFASDGGDRPDMQIHFLPLSSERRGWTFHRFSGVTANVCQLRPASRGRIGLGSADPRHRLASIPATCPTSATERPSSRVSASPASCSAIHHYRRGTAPRRGCPGSGTQAMQHSWTTPATPAAPSSTRSAPAAWARTTASSTRASGCGAPRICGWPTPRSCRTSPPATRTRQR